MKFEIFQSDKNDKHFFNLIAGNGQVILSSQGYASKDGCKKGIASVQNNCGQDECFTRNEAKNGKFYFNMIAKNKQVIGKSQMYASKQGMENGIASVKKTAPQAIIEG